MSRRLPARCKRCTRCPLAIDTGCRLRTLEAPARLFAVWPRVQMYTADCPAKQPRASQTSGEPPAPHPPTLTSLTPLLPYNPPLSLLLPDLPCCYWCWLGAESTDAVHDESQHQVVITKGVGSDATIQEGWRLGGEGRGGGGWVGLRPGEENGEGGKGGGGNEMEF